MPIYLGEKKVKEIFVGSTAIEKVFSGKDLVYDRTKWTCMWSGIAPMEYCYYNGNNYYYPEFNLVAGAPTQVSAELHGCSDYGCIGYIVADDILESITVDKSGETSNLPWLSPFINECLPYGELLYLKGKELCQSSEIRSIPGYSYGGIVIVTEIWQKI